MIASLKIIRRIIWMILANYLNMEMIKEDKDK